MRLLSSVSSSSRKVPPLSPLPSLPFPSPSPIPSQCARNNPPLTTPPDLEWKLTYVGSAQSDNYDQELDTLLVGPIPVGVNKFVFEADPPDLKRIPLDELLGVTVVLLTCAYDGREFVRVGYYVNNEYDSEELVNAPPAQPVIEKIRRNVLAEKPRVTRFAIKWYALFSVLQKKKKVSLTVAQGLRGLCPRRVPARAARGRPRCRRGGVRRRGACRGGGRAG